MMRWSDLPLDPSRRMLRQFAGLWIVFFGGLAAWRWFITGDQGTATMLLAALAVTIGPLGALVPAVVRPIFIAWTVLVFPVGWVVSRVLLVVLFGVVMTPIALLFRAIGRDPLRLRRQQGARSYWTPKPAAVDMGSYFRQF